MKAFATWPELSLAGGCVGESNQGSGVKSSSGLWCPARDQAVPLFVFKLGNHVMVEECRLLCEALVKAVWGGFCGGGWALSDCLPSIVIKTNYTPSSVYSWPDCSRPRYVQCHKRILLSHAKAINYRHLLLTETVHEFISIYCSPYFQEKKKVCSCQCVLAWMRICLQITFVTSCQLHNS